MLLIGGSLATEMYYATCRVQLGEDEPFTDILKEVLHNYGSSVQHGIRHVYQSLPRLLTVWFDYGSHCLSKPSGACNKKVGSRKPCQYSMLMVFFYQQMVISALP